MKSHPSFLTNKKYLFSFLVLLVLLWTTLSHSVHAEYYDITEQHECQLCQQSIDTPPDNDLTVQLNVRLNIHVFTSFTGITPLTKSYTLPSLRAPPYFL